MTERDEWGPIIEHDGRPCPIVGKYARIYIANGDVVEKIAGSWEGPSNGLAVDCWRWSDKNLQALAWDRRVVAYSIRKPRALQQLRKLVETLPERETA